MPPANARGRDLPVAIRPTTAVDHHLLDRFVRRPSSPVSLASSSASKSLEDGRRPSVGASATLPLEQSVWFSSMKSRHQSQRNPVTITELQLRQGNRHGLCPHLERVRLHRPLHHRRHHRTAPRVSLAVPSLHGQHHFCRPRLHPQRHRRINRGAHVPVLLNRV